MYHIVLFFNFVLTNDPILLTSRIVKQLLKGINFQLPNNIIELILSQMTIYNL